MSKLFEAISQLENSANQSAVEMPFKASGQKGKGLHFLKNKILILSGLIILAGVCLVFFMEDSIKLFFKKTTAKQHYYAETNELDRPLNEEFQNEKLKNNLNKITQSNKTENLDLKKIALHYKKIQKNTKLTQKNISSHIKSATKSKQIHNELKKLIPTNDTLQKHDYHQVVKIKKQKNITKKNPNVLTFRHKKLLFQAERFRKKGELNRALMIYKKIWNDTKNPLVANNLAAILIEKGDYKKAEEILKTAIKLRPHDEELIYNLSVVTSYLKQSQKK